MPKPKTTNHQAKIEDENAEKSKRMSISLSPREIKMIEALRGLQGGSLNDVIKKAIATESIIQREVYKGAEISLEYPDGDKTRVLFR